MKDVVLCKSLRHSENVVEAHVRGSKDYKVTTETQGTWVNVPEKECSLSNVVVGQWGNLLLLNV